MIFHQLFEKETSTYTYLLADEETREAILIDPVIEMVERDIELIKDLQLQLKYVLDTHVHADHITASGELRKRLGAIVAISSAYDLSCADLHLEDGQVLEFGSHSIKVIHTPGHTSGCLSYQVDKMVFTGDALLIRGCGRTDFQEGSAAKLFDSVREKIFSLSDDTIIYPGHDYKGFSQSSIALEKKLNPRLKLEISKIQFIEIMNNLKLAHPKKIQEAVPANLNCGVQAFSDYLKGERGIANITALNFLEIQGHVRLIDVRGDDEFNGELGHIHGASLVTLGPGLEECLDKMSKETPIVFVCRSGKRSTQAAHLAINKGFDQVLNLEGGMLAWNESGLKVEKDLGGS